MTTPEQRKSNLRMALILASVAAVFFNEQQELSARVYFGVAIILGVVFAQGLLAGRRAPRHAQQVGVNETHHVAD